MPIIIFSISRFSGKDGRKWANIAGVSEKGEGVSALVAEADLDSWDINEKAIVSKEQLAAMFKELPVCEAFFNQRGRLESVKA